MARGVESPLPLFLSRIVVLYIYTNSHISLTVRRNAANGLLYIMLTRQCNYPLEIRRPLNVHSRTLFYRSLTMFSKIKIARPSVGVRFSTRQIGASSDTENRWFETRGVQKGETLLISSRVHEHTWPERIFQKSQTNLYRVSGSICTPLMCR